MEISLLLVKEKTRLQEKATRAAKALLTVWVISLYLISTLRSNQFLIYLLLSFFCYVNTQKRGGICYVNTQKQGGIQTSYRQLLKPPMETTYLVPDSKGKMKEMITFSVMKNVNAAGSKLPSV